ncbi:MAG: Macrolide export ATP-binding/permease protein MacB [Luteibacter sp.]|uniref:ABC transporter permease n=1 Tax=Luteibacter sp. TaxID=1886636 RepID=UPI001384BD9E|nr:ABC transporter permease [Luteibacter sp.]KAF1007418.1 MAG: Macrolide export ATP-binding/permease protein MacB [Luteibacter sp.]
MIKNMRFDLAHAWRLFVRSPGNSLLCILVVALSVGLSLFVFVIDYNIGLKPLPFDGSSSWLSVQTAENTSASLRPRMDPFTYNELRKRTKSVDYLGAFSPRAPIMSEGEASMRLRGAAIEPSLLAAFGRQPLLGRLFDDRDAAAGTTSSLILSYDTWQTYFAGDPNIVGKQVRMDGKMVSVAGVMPRDFFAFQDFEVWTPLQKAVIATPDPSLPKVTVVARAAGGASSDAVEKDLSQAIASVNADYPQSFGAKRSVAVFPAHRMYTHDNIPVIAMATFIAIAVLLLGGLNISMIFFAMLMERSRELALRTALGSTRWRVLRQCLLQSFFVIAFGLVVGAVLAVLAVHWAHGLLDFTSRLQASGRDPNELLVRPIDFLVAIIAAAVLWLLSTLIPAWRISRLDPAATLAGTGKGAAAKGSQRTTSILVGVQVVISSLLLVICANIASAVNRELQKPVGVAEENLLLSTYSSALGARYATPDDRIRYWDQLDASIRQRIPGATVGYMTASPTAPAMQRADIEDRAGATDKNKFELPFSTVSSNYFDMLGIAIRSGRAFDATDVATTQQVAIVDERTATQYWPNRDPIGQRIQIDPEANGPWLTIVGVASAVAGPYSDSVGVVYRPLKQAAPTGFQLLVKVPGIRGDTRDTLRAAAFDVDPDVPLHNLQRLDEYLVAINSYKSMVPGFTGIALITVILAASGLFGLISRSVAQRTQEIEIMRALGSTSGRIIRRFMRQAMWYLIVGLVGGVVGVVLTTGMTGVVPNALDGVVPVTIGVLFVMVAVIFGSSYIPARRAVVMEPGDALRYE